MGPKGECVPSGDCSYLAVHLRFYLVAKQQKTTCSIVAIIIEMPYNLASYLTANSMSPNRGTDRQMDGQTVGQRQIDRWVDRQTDGQTESCTDGHTPGACEE